MTDLLIPIPIRTGELSTVWSRNQIPTSAAKYRNGIEIGIGIFECKSAIRLQKTNFVQSDLGVEAEHV